tara:strand:+ start:329 stop:781 length:453 start_codon:yes stop_codon:yes gene_type:complete
MDLEKKIEYIIIFSIVILLSLTFWPDKNTDTSVKIEINEDDFNNHPLIAWKDTHKKWDGKKGDIVKIRYRVTKPETKLWVYDDVTRELVHEQTLIRDPWPDGRHRDFTYVWKLYKTERTQYIPSGDYIIVIGNLYEPVSLLGKITTSIKI